MSTRGVIARPRHMGFIGRYHHCDGYPTGVGKELYKLYNGFFNKDLDHMLEFLIDEHPAGWSNIIDTDFSLPAGYRELYGGPSVKEGGPLCYCHGDRYDKEHTYTEKAMGDTDIEYVYVLYLDEDNRPVMHISTPKFWAKMDSRICFYVFLDTEEPDWDAIEDELNEA